MDDNKEYTLELKERQHKYLVDMANKYSLPDESKALRCLINYAIEKIAEEKSIFNEVRCADC